MEKLKLDKWESVFLYDEIAHQIQEVREHVARFEDGPNNLTDGECSLTDKIHNLCIISLNVV